MRPSQANVSVSPHGKELGSDPPGLTPVPDSGFTEKPAVLCYLRHEFAAELPMPDFLDSL